MLAQSARGSHIISDLLVADLELSKTAAARACGLKRSLYIDAARLRRSSTVDLGHQLTGDAAAAKRSHYSMLTVCCNVTYNVSNLI